MDGTRCGKYPKIWLFIILIITVRRVGCGEMCMIGRMEDEGEMEWKGEMTYLGSQLIVSYYVHAIVHVAFLLGF